MLPFRNVDPISFFEQYSRTLGSFRIPPFSRGSVNPPAVVVKAAWSEPDSCRPLPDSGPISCFQKDSLKLGLFGNKPYFRRVVGPAGVAISAHVVAARCPRSNFAIYFQ